MSRLYELLCGDVVNNSGNNWIVEPFLYLWQQNHIIMRTKRLFLSILLALATIAHSHAQDVLSEAVVTAASNGLTIRDNLIIYDVSKDSLAANKSLNSLITTMPLVRYNRKERTLSVDGKDNISILLNGRKSLVINKSNFYYISELLAGKKIDSITINTAPDGPYYNYSAVIDIKSQDVLSNLFTGAVSLAGSTKYSFSPDLGITCGNGRLTTNISYKYDWTHLRPVWNYSESRLNQEMTPLYMATDTSFHVPSNTHDIKVALSYDISPNDILFASGSFVFSDEKYKSSSVSAINGVMMSMTGENTSDCRKGKGSLAYQHFFDQQFQKLLTVQYSREAMANSNLYGVSNNENRYTNVQQIVSADYFHTINRAANWTATLAWFSRRYDSEMNGINIMDHDQDVVKADILYSRQIGMIRLSAKMAYDYTYDCADFHNGEQPLYDSYGALRYEARANWFLGAGHSLMAIASRNVYRPDIRFRNPYRDESVAGIVRQGNPMLSNEKIDNVFFRYNYIKGAKFSTGASVSLTHSSDGVFSASKLMEDGRLFKSYYSGIGYTDIRVGPDFMYRPNEKISIDFTYILNYASFLNESGTNSLFLHYLNLNSNWYIGKNGELNLLVNIKEPTTLHSSNTSQMIRPHYIATGSISYTHRFGHSLIGTLSINDPWYRRLKCVMETLVDGKEIYSVNNSPGQVICVMIQYNFGNFKSFVKRNTRQVSDTDRNK